MNRTSLVFIVAAILAGCSKSSDKITTAEKSVSGNSVSLAEAAFDLPAGWKVFDMTKGDFTKAMDGWVGANPQLKSTADAVKVMANNKAFRVFAFDVVDSEPGFADNLNALVLEQGVPANLDELVAQSQSQLAALPGATILSPFKREMVGSNEFVHAQINMKDGLGHDLMMDSYSVIRHGKSISFTFTCLKPHAPEFTKAGRRVMETVRLK